MLELQDVSLFVGHGEDIQAILGDINIRLPNRHFVAVIGPSGCGKSTLLKTIAGIVSGREEGTIRWNSRDLSAQDFGPTELGYVPQFSIAHDELTVSECVDNSVKLRVRGLSAADRKDMVRRTLAEVGLTDFADRRVGVLSGGQKRRLALAMEIASAPTVLLCDEVTSGLDAQSENEIVELLHQLAKNGRLVISVTHSLRHIHLYDSVVVLQHGALAYHGSPSDLSHYFSVGNLEDLYARLEEREPSEWTQSWRKHAKAYEIPIEEKPAPPSGEAPSEVGESPESRLPGFLSQFFTLLGRRFRIFSRSRGQLLLQLGLILGFPFLVAIFAWNGLPQIRNLSVGLDQNAIAQIAEKLAFLDQASTVGSLVSGIVMFQVILLTLMGANNSGREIAAERLIFEKEKLSGLRPSSFIASKAAFLSVLVLVQSVWMGLFVHFVCNFPGELGAQLLFLVLVNAAMTSICLAVSSWMQTAEQASLVSIYLVGFQLPLSGAVLALPETIGNLVRPFISAYWSWSGVLQTLVSERYYEIVQMVVQTSLSPSRLCAWMLAAHIVIGLFLAWMGSRVSRMS